MPKSLALGNGNILILLDKYAQVDDLYFPYVGLENHSGGRNVHRIGVWTEGKISWLQDLAWEIRISYKKETLVSEITATNPKLDLELKFADAVYNEKNIFIRKITVKNLARRQREVKLFFNQQFHIYETKRGDTAYFDPDDKVIIHYKGRRVFLISLARPGLAIRAAQGADKTSGVKDVPTPDVKRGAEESPAEKPPFDYSVGIFHAEGKEGTWRDAEDGVLERNPVEHGSVDSTVGCSVTVGPRRTRQVSYWICIAKTLREAKDLHAYVRKKTPAYIINSTEDYWRAWVNKLNFTFYGLEQKTSDLFKKSLLLIRTHVDNRGGILASADYDLLQYGRDTYSYVWPRDGAYVALALDKAGYFELTRKFYEFCNDVITEDGYLLHKYLPDKAIGSSWHPWVKDGKKQLAIQEDETAIILYGLWEHYKVNRDLEFIEEVYNSLIKKAANFLVDYRDSQTKLPLGSYDLWEEKFGTSTYTSAAVFGGLTAASNFAQLLGKEDQAQKFTEAADEVQKAILKHLYNQRTGYFARFVTLARPGLARRAKPSDEVKGLALNESTDNTLDISSFYGIFRFNVLDIKDQRLNKALSVVEDELCCKTIIGGTARYKGDKYHLVDPNLPGNPWFITTLWLTQYRIARAAKEDDLDLVKEQLAWVTDKALPSGVLSEQLNPYTGEQISVAPLTWSHAEFILTVIAYLEKLEELGICTVCYPVK